MAFTKQLLLVVPLAVVIGCAGAKQNEKVTKAGGNSTLRDEGPASTSGQGAPATAQAGAAGAAAGAAGAAAAGQAAAPQLVTFQGRNGFTVMMPPNPQTDDRTQETPGGSVQVHIAQAQDASGKYMSSLSEFPKGSLDKVKSKDLLDSLQQATIQSMGGTLVNSQDVQVGGLPGREFTATDPEGSQVTARVFVGDSRVYTLAGTYPKGQMPGSIQQFLGSFQPPAASAAIGGSGTAGASSEDGAPGSDLKNNEGSSSSDTGETISGSSPDSSASSAPAEPTKKQKKSRRSSSSTSSTTESSTGTSSGSR